MLVALEPSLQRQVMPAPKYPETTSSETFPGTFWHFSDLHLEFSYTVGSNSSNLCHIPTSGDAPDNEEDGSGAGAAGAYGCDSPPVSPPLKPWQGCNPTSPLFSGHTSHIDVPPRLGRNISPRSPVLSSPGSLSSSQESLLWQLLATMTSPHQTSGQWGALRMPVSGARAGFPAIFPLDSEIPFSTVVSIPQRQLD